MRLPVFQSACPPVRLVVCTVSLFFLVGADCGFAQGAQRQHHAGRADSEKTKREAVAACLTALNRNVRQDKRYDRILHLDRYVLRARLRTDDDIFSIGQPVRVDASISIKGSARRRGHWQWQPVMTRCGLRHGHVVATSIEPRAGRSGDARDKGPGKPSDKPTDPAETPRLRPGANYVGIMDNTTL